MRRGRTAEHLREEARQGVVLECAELDTNLLALSQERVDATAKFTAEEKLPLQIVTGAPWTEGVGG